jgi:hypothetical protein
VVVEVVLLVDVVDVVVNGIEVVVDVVDTGIPVVLVVVVVDLGC